MGSTRTLVEFPLQCGGSMGEKVIDSGIPERDCLRENSWGIGVFEFDRDHYRSCHRACYIFPRPAMYNWGSLVGCSQKRMAVQSALRHAVNS
jgi:hypothetical protein